MAWRTVCLACCGTKLEKVIDLGMHPLADTFISPDDRSNSDRLWPLECDLCLMCGHVQNRCIIEPYERYVYTDYSYTSSNSEYSRRHWTQFAKDVSSLTGLQPGDRVVEIGSNDGFLCAEFNKLGFQGIGVDPSPVMVKLAEARGVETIESLFHTGIAYKLIEKFTRRVPLIVANNVVNHADELQEFMRGVRELLSLDGTFVFELPHLLRSVEDGRVDQFYHEHVSYFTVTSAAVLLWLNGMKIIRVEVNGYHGGSIRVLAQRSAGSLGTNTEESAKAVIAKEGTLAKPDTYRRLMARARRERAFNLEELSKHAAAGVRSACVGAAAKSNTFLNWYGLSGKSIEFITDASPNKIGKLTPGTRIPIVHDIAFANQGEMLAIVTAWNINDLLVAKLKEINPQLKFFVLNRE